MKKFLCFVLMFSMVYAQQDKTKDEESSEAEAFMKEMANSATEESVDDSESLNPQQSFEENPKYNVHEYNYKQQAIVGGTVMFCVVLSLVMNNNYNPKRGK